MTVDPGTGLAVLGTAVGSAKLVEKILGPTAEYLGSGMRDWTERGVRNVGRIFTKAAERLGDRVDEPGSVPPKVLKEILAEGAFAEDSLSNDYFAGVLASSKSGRPRDDRGAAFAALIGRLSTYQIRAHFLFYTLIRQVFVGKSFNLASEQRANCELYIPIESFVSGMELSGNESVDVIVPHVSFGLHREGLIEGSFMFGDVNHLRARFPLVERTGMLVTPSPLGAELFLWAHGAGELHINCMLEAAKRLDSETNITVTTGITSTKYPELRLSAND